MSKAEHQKLMLISSIQLVTQLPSLFLAIYSVTLVLLLPVQESLPGSHGNLR